MSWIHRDDVVSAMVFLLDNPELEGAFNVTAPAPVTGRGFCQAMQRQRRTLVTLPVPASVMRVMLGEMADELLINGQRVIPARLLQAGFEFRYPDIDSALTAIAAA